MISLRSKGNPYMLIVGMTGVKMGDRMLQVGCSDGGALAAVAAKVGLSGRALVVVPDEASATRARKGAARQGVLVEIEIASPTRLPEDEGTFDLVVVDDSAGGFAALDANAQTDALREALRVLEPGGRCLVITALPATGLAAMLGRGTRRPPLDPTPSFEAAGFRFIRELAEREGLRFVEGMKPRA